MLASVAGRTGRGGLARGSHADRRGWTETRCQPDGRRTARGRSLAWPRGALQKVEGRASRRPDLRAGGAPWCRGRGTRRRRACSAALVRTNRLEGPPRPVSHHPRSEGPVDSGEQARVGGAPVEHGRATLRGGACRHRRMPRRRSRPGRAGDERLGRGEPARWLNLQAQPTATVHLADDPPRRVSAHVAEGPERDRLWSLWRSIHQNLDGYAALRSTPTAVVALTPTTRP
jgi:hypothetical protein